MGFRGRCAHPCAHPRLFFSRFPVSRARRFRRAFGSAVSVRDDNHGRSVQQQWRGHHRPFLGDLVRALPDRDADPRRLLSKAPQPGAGDACGVDRPGRSDRKLQNMTSQFAFPVARVDDVKMPRRDIPTRDPGHARLRPLRSPRLRDQGRRQVDRRRWRRSNASSPPYSPLEVEQQPG